MLVSRHSIGVKGHRSTSWQDAASEVTYSQSVCVCPCITQWGVFCFSHHGFYLCDTLSHSERLDISFVTHSFCSILVHTVWTGSFSSPSSSSSPSSNPRVHEFWCADAQVLHVLAQQDISAFDLLFGVKNKKNYHLGSWMEPWGDKLQTSWKFYWHPLKKSYTHTFPGS